LFGNKLSISLALSSQVFDADDALLPRFVFRASDGAQVASRKITEPVA
jgi:hypothetical protein